MQRAVFPCLVACAILRLIPTVVPTVAETLLFSRFGVVLPFSIATLNAVLADRSWDIRKISRPRTSGPWLGSAISSVLWLWLKSSHLDFSLSFILSIFIFLLGCAILLNHLPVFLVSIVFLSFLRGRAPLPALLLSFSLRFFVLNFLRGRAFLSARLLSFSLRFFVLTWVVLREVLSHVIGYVFWQCDREGHTLQKRIQLYCCHRYWESYSVDTS